MARKLRLQYPGAIYHLMSRGDRREPVFLDDPDRQFVPVDPGQSLQEKTGWQVHAYCLMSNHFHLVIETPKGNLVAGMKWLLGTYTARFNRKHKLVGHLFSGRYKSLLVDNSGNGYLKTVCDYVHFKPGASQASATGPGAGGVFLEQLWAVFAPAWQAGAMAAGGPVAGRNGHCCGQRGGPEGIYAADGSQSKGGSHWRIQKKSGVAGAMGMRRFYDANCCSKPASKWGSIIMVRSGGKVRRTKPSGWWRRD